MESVWVLYVKRGTHPDPARTFRNHPEPTRNPPDPTQNLRNQPEPTRNPPTPFGAPSNFRSS